jgi:hypothetical protein
VNLLTEIIAFIGNFLVKGIFIGVLIVGLSRKLFKTKFDTQHAVHIIKWVMLTYSVLVVIFFLLLFLVPANSGEFISLTVQATGHYSWAFWLMILGSILPLMLFFKKSAYNIYLLFTLGIFMNIGWLLESMVIHTTIIERDYPREISGFKAILPFDRELIILLKGLIFGIVALLIGNLIFFRKKQLAD